MSLLQSTWALKRKSFPQFDKCFKTFIFKIFAYLFDGV